MNTPESMPTAERTLSLAFSPCPNDTFMFGALVAGHLASRGLHVEEHLHDIETLNEHLLAGRFDVSKASFYAYLKRRDAYALLDAGAALGFGCGPLVVARSPEALADPRRACVAVPGQWTTAHLLLRLWNPFICQRRFVPYDRVMTEVRAGRADAGVIIHESRFVYAEAGLIALADLGAWWEQETGLPIPLGGIVARRSLGPAVIARLEGLVRDSIGFARSRPDAVRDYVRTHARELCSDVLERHIAMFVNDFSLHLGDRGRAAVECLAARAQQLEETETP